MGSPSDHVLSSSSTCNPLADPLASYPCNQLANLLADPRAQRDSNQILDLIPVLTRQSSQSVVTNTIPPSPPPRRALLVLADQLIRSRFLLVDENLLVAVLRSHRFLPIICGFNQDPTTHPTSLSTLDPSLLHTTMAPPLPRFPPAETTDYNCFSPGC